MGFLDKIFGNKNEEKNNYGQMSDAEIESYFKDKIIENNLIIMDYITDEECLSNIYVNCADSECANKAKKIRDKLYSLKLLIIMDIILNSINLHI